MGASGAVTNGWHALLAGSWAADAGTLHTWLGDWILGPLQDLLAVCPSDVSCGVCRLSTYGDAPVVVTEIPAPNLGAASHASAASAASVLTWRTPSSYAGSQGHTWLPLPIDFVADDRQHINLINWAELQQAARSYLEHFNAIVAPSGGPSVLGVLHQRRRGAYLQVAELEPVFDGDASPFVGTMHRRIRMRRPVSSHL